MYKNNQLKKECYLLSKHLFNESPSSLVVYHYIRFHEIRGFEPLIKTQSEWANWISKKALSNLLWLRIIDFWTNLFSNKSLLRHKITLMIAFCETVYPHHLNLEEPDTERSAYRCLITLTGILIKSFVNIIFCIIMPVFYIEFLLSKLSKSKRLELPT